MSLMIHPTAIVSPKAELADNVEIGPYCIVGEKVTLGEGTKLNAFVHIYSHTVMGKKCIVFDGAVLGAIPQDLSYRGEETWVRIGDNVTCRESVTINRAVGGESNTIVESGSFIMEGVHLGHNVRIGHSCIVANRATFGGHVIVGDFAVIGGMAAFHQFVHIGAYCMIGGLSAVTQDVPPFALAAGNPIYLYDINKVGLQRRGFSQDRRTKIRQMLKLLYNSSLNMSDALNELEIRYPGDEDAWLILKFARESTRGFIPRVTRGDRRGKACEGSSKVGD